MSGACRTGSGPERAGGIGKLIGGITKTASKKFVVTSLLSRVPGTDPSGDYQKAPPSYQVFFPEM
jgi:hypothetical protein